MKLGACIRQERNHQKLTQEALAEAADVSVKYLSAIENGKESNISIGYLIAVSSALQVKLSDWLVEAEEESELLKYIILSLFLSPVSDTSGIRFI